jgi:hypothetical protein
VGDVETMGLGWCRIKVYWNSVQPTEPGQWDWSRPDSFVDQCVRAKLKMIGNLAYTPAWAGNGAASSVPNKPDDWTAFVKRAVARYPQIEFWQLWNEPTAQAGFWQGTDSQFVELIHNPAAQAVRGAGKKVVFGGWPQNGGIPRYVRLLGMQGCAELTDVLDIHYYGAEAYEPLNRAYPDKPIWQTEIGDTATPQFLTQKYEAIIAWAKASTKWKTPDQFRLFWYPAWSTDELGLSKTSGGVGALTENGKQMRSLAAKYKDGIEAG